jgi:energy-coupling factor transport system substrate-specific component
LQLRSASQCEGAILREQAGDLSPGVIPIEADFVHADHYPNRSVSSGIFDFVQCALCDSGSLGAWHVPAGRGPTRGDQIVLVRARAQAVMSWVVLATASLVGLGCFLYPFLLPATVSQAPGQEGQAGIAPYLFAGIGAVCVLAAVVTTSPQAGNGRSREVALLGVLVAIDAALRLVPSVLGATPVFLLIMLTGVVFGSTLGFQMGALSLVFSALITGGVGPWLPFQMMGAGWIGMTAGWLPRRGPHWFQIGIIAVFAAFWGFAYGALMNLWFWPFSAPGVGADVGLYWSPGLGTWETVLRYARFYAVTSLGFDLARAIGNVGLVLLFGSPILRLLDRYRSRFTWTAWDHGVQVPEPAQTPSAPAT